MLKKTILTLFLSLIFSTQVFAFEVPIDAKLDYNQGIDFYKLGMYERSIESFRKAINTYPDYIDAYYNLGTVLEYLRNYSEAIVAYRQLYTRNPHDYEVIYKLANLYIKLGDKQNASKYITLIPPANSYYDKAQDLITMYNLSNQLPEPVYNPPSNVADSNGIYENILSPTGVVTDSDGNVYVATFSDNSILKITPDNKRILFFNGSEIKGPISLALDSVNNLYISNYNANNVLKISPQGLCTVLVDKLDKPYGLHINGNMLFITCQGSNSIYRHKIEK